MKLIINGYPKEIKPTRVVMHNTRHSRQYRAEIMFEGSSLSEYDKEKFEDRIKEKLKEE